MRQLAFSRLLRAPLLPFGVAGIVWLATSLEASPLRNRSLENAGWTAGDFDGDDQLDLAIARSRGHNGYSLEVELSARRAGGFPGRPDLPISAFGYHLSPRDVDGDHDLDIVITWGFARLPVAVWINDGEGRFSEGSFDVYPAWNRLDVLLYSQSLPAKSQPVFSPNRRSRFILERSNSSFRPFLPLSRLLAHGPQFLICFSPADERSARAPPQPLFS